MSKNLYIDFHVLQTVPPSCVNRDDTGSPKTAIYGGCTRARVSSQSWKRAIRLMFEDEFTTDDVGKRTKKIVELVAKEIQNISSNINDEDALKKAEKVLEAAAVKKKGKDIDALFFISIKQAKELAKLALEDGESKKEICQAAVKANPSIDMALFGRMVANDPSLNYDAAAQVAHAISTHSVHNEYDYFTAIDDCSPEDNAGAGHLGTVEYNSSTLYRYATINVTELENNLKSDTARAIRGFANAFIRSMPTGKKNTFANNTLPDEVYVAIRCDQPINLVGAFETPVRASEKGYVTASINKLNDYASKIYNSYLDRPENQWSIGESICDSQVVTLKELLVQIEEIIKGETNKSEVM